jgi:hypothetical protein
VEQVPWAAVAPGSCSSDARRTIDNMSSEGEA